MKTCSLGNDPDVLSGAVVTNVQRSLVDSQDGKHSFASILQLLDLTVSVGGKEQGLVIKDKAGCDKKKINKK